MKLLSGFAIVITVALVCWTDSKLDQWEDEQQVMAINLLSSVATPYAPLQEWDDLPAIVQDYLSHVVDNNKSAQTAKAFSVKQEGEFLMKKDQYVPFTAQEIFVMNPPGFAWEGKIAMVPSVPNWFPKLFVSDSWVEQEGHFRAAVQAIVPILSLDSSTTSTGGDGASGQMTLGQATRWLADAVLLPSSLHPDAGIVTWKSVDDAPEKAILELPIANIHGLKLEATFDGGDSQGLLTKVTGQKPFMRSKNDFEMKTWQVNFLDYQRQEENGMMVPMKMESGWINEEGDFEA
ncbi:MAG: hypothetical protein SGBAC_013581, partial [Bacillariaceae sp.]